MIRLAVLLGILVGCLAGGLPVAALANVHYGSVTKFFSNEVVGPDETIHGDVNVIFGSATIAGRVTGNLNVLGGSCRLLDTGTIDGEEHCAWNTGATALAPFIAAPPSADEFAQTDRRLFVKLLSNAVVVLMFLLFPLRMRFALDRVERHPGQAAAAGVATVIAVLPIAIILVFSVVGIPLIVVEVAALFAGVWLGTGAVALLVGRRLCELVMPRLTPAPLSALLLGLIVVSAAEIVPAVGWAVTALVWLVGIGASLLAFMPGGGADSRRSAHVGGRPPIGGPPMKPSI